MRVPPAVRILPVLVFHMFALQVPAARATVHIMGRVGNIGRIGLKIDRIAMNVQAVGNGIALGTCMLALACGTATSAQQDRCEDVPVSFVSYVARTLSDSTGMFAEAYPPVTPLTCELLVVLQEELKNDSARYHFERFSRRYWIEDPHARRTHAYIERHLSFPLAMAATAHWFADTRVEGLHELQEYRRMRPLVCTTQQGYAQLLRQDRAAVRYLIRVLETTPLGISGSENATIHSTYMRAVMRTLDLFTGQAHVGNGQGQVFLEMPERSLQRAISDWYAWLDE